MAKYTLMLGKHFLPLVLIPYSAEIFPIEIKNKKIVEI